ncbi:MAG: membrane-bound O-acyltransferase family protein [Desulfobulbus propionicus]|nr:MAG: membrane-bound O-acyltransferase family protein [Desulfobulbus propionicus]
MLFSSPVFLFGFLPLTLFLYYISPRKLKNIILLFCSLFFYAWGEVFYVLVMIVSIVYNYSIGILLYKYEDNLFLYKFLFFIGVFVNIIILVFFKYFNFIIENINIVFIGLNFEPFCVDPVHLPLGISFFTFQSISYIVDIYRKESIFQRNIIDLALYISLFPQLIAGPIVRYYDIARQITGRTHFFREFAEGVQRFVYGLGKKMLLANPLGEVADSVFALSGTDLTMPLAWIGIAAYTLQIFFDFSGYSDMAIGLGRMFGFHFRENFNYPYIASSLREFWRRWHISLSTWFRDYVYIPLGGSRVAPVRVYCNLFIVFILTGFWHGASWNFIVWGLFHGIFLAAEHAGFSTFLKKLWQPLQHFYVILVVLIAWVFFRSETLSLSMAYLQAMADFGNWETTKLQFLQVLSYESMYAFFVGIFLSMPVCAYGKEYIYKKLNTKFMKLLFCVEIVNLTSFFIILTLSILKVSASTYNPFIYFRF